MITWSTSAIRPAKVTEMRRTSPDRRAIRTAGGTPSSAAGNSPSPARARVSQSSWECFSGIVERRLVDQRILFQSMFERAGIGMAVMDLEGRLLMVNRRLREMLGYGIAELHGMRLEEITHPEDYPRELAILKESRQADQGRSDQEKTEEEKAYCADKRYRRKDGTFFWAQLTATLIRDDDGRPLYGFGTFEDVTERLKGEKLRAEYTRRLVSIEEEGRRRFARNLHDILGPELTALGIDLNLALLLAPAELPEQVTGHLLEGVSRVKQIARNMRNLMAELRPLVLDEYGLAAALRAHADQLTKLTGLPVTVVAEEPTARLPLEVEIALFRIAQEALANAARHAGARRLSVVLEAQPTAVHLAVEDDGVGFIPAAGPVAEPKHWGLIHMRERAQGIGGRLTVHSTPGAGTRIDVRVPVERA